MSLVESYNKANIFLGLIEYELDIHSVLLTSYNIDWFIFNSYSKFRKIFETQKDFTIPDQNKHSL